MVSASAKVMVLATIIGQFQIMKPKISQKATPVAKALICNSLT